MTSRIGRMRRPLTALLVLCVAIPAVALGADTDPKKRITPADQAKARSILLKRADFVAGWKRVPATPDSEDLVCPGFNPNESDLTLTGEAEAEFEHTQGVVSVSSFSEVFVSKADALKSWTRNDKPAVARCIGHFFREGATDAGTQVKIVSAGRMAFPKLAPRRSAFKVVARVTVTANGQPQTVPFTIQFLALGHGRGDTAMLAISPGSGLATADLRAFGKLLATRLAAAKL
jgi:hypothetical protein